MSESKSARHVEQEIERLEAHINELIAKCEALKEENRLLLKQQQTFTTERATLLKRNELAKTRVEAMIDRLKSLEHVT